MSDEKISGGMTSSSDASAQPATPGVGAAGPGPSAEAGDLGYAPGAASPTLGEVSYGANGNGGARTKLKSQADEFMQAAKQRAKDIATEQKDAAAAQLGCVARGLRDAAQSMQGESEFAGRYAGRAAEGLERFSQDLHGADFDDLIERTESYARRNPAVFLGGAVAAGFLFARFLKSSRERSAHRSSFERRRARAAATPSDVASGA